MPEKNEVAPVTANTIRDTIAERIRSEFVNLLPPGAFEKLVASELEDFQKETDPYGRRRGRSPLQDLVRAEVRERLLAGIKAELDKPEYARAWGNEQQVGAMIRAIAKECVPHFVENLLAEQLQNFTTQLRANLQSLR